MFDRNRSGQAGHHFRAKHHGLLMEPMKNQTYTLLLRLIHTDEFKAAAPTLFSLLNWSKRSWVPESVTVTCSPSSFFVQHYKQSEWICFCLELELTRLICLTKGEDHVRLWKHMRFAYNRIVAPAHCSWCLRAASTHCEANYVCTISEKNLRKRKSIGIKRAGRWSECIVLDTRWSWRKHFLLKNIVSICSTANYYARSEQSKRQESELLMMHLREKYSMYSLKNICHMNNKETSGVHCKYSSILHLRRRAYIYGQLQALALGKTWYWISQFLSET